MELQHINVKLLVKEQGVSLDPVIPLFHRWIQERAFEELLLDVADYRHVQGGPEVILIGHEADYSVDNTDNRLGVRYNRKAVLNGDNQARLKQAARAALSACRRLEAQPELNLHFNGQEVEVVVNDRLLAPNRAETWQALQSDVTTFAETLFQGSEYSLQRDADPRPLFSVFLKSSKPFTVAQLLVHLGS